MRGVKVVSFDVDGTLVDRRFCDLVWERGVPGLYARKEGLDLERAREYVLGEYRKVGERRLEWYDIRYWFRRLGLGEEWRELLRDYEREIVLYPEVPGVLENLSGEYPLVVTSNSAREFLDVELREIGRCFARVFSATSDFGRVKKTASVYRRVCEALNVEPREMAHVGDHRNFDSLVPRRLGVQAFYLDRRGRETGKFVVHDLREFESRLTDATR